MTEVNQKSGPETSPEVILLVGAAQSVWAGSDAVVKIELNVTQRLALHMSSEGIKPIKSIFITDSDIRHIKRSHARAEESRGQIPIEPEDFGLLPTILESFDSCEHTDTDKLGNKKFLLSKEVGDVYYVVSVQRGANKLQIKTMWKKPGAAC